MKAHILRKNPTGRLRLLSQTSSLTRIMDQTSGTGVSAEVPIQMNANEAMNQQWQTIQNISWEFLSQNVCFWNVESETDRVTGKTERGTSEQVHNEIGRKWLPRKCQSLGNSDWCTSCCSQHWNVLCLVSSSKFWFRFGRPTTFEVRCVFQNSNLWVSDCTLFLERGQICPPPWPPKVLKAQNFILPAC